MRHCDLYPGWARRGGLLLAVVLLALPRISAAFEENENAIIGMVLTESNTNCNNIDLVDCEDVDAADLSGDLFTPYYAILYVFNADPEAGIAGVSLGLDYDGGNGSGVDISSWKRCADLEFTSDSPAWPASRSGNRVTWTATTHCQEEEPSLGGGVAAVIGYFYLTAYSDDELKIIPHPALQSGPELKVSACNANDSDLRPEQGGSLGFSGDESVEGSLPCDEGRSVEDATWGEVKTSYNDK